MEKIRLGDYNLMTVVKEVDFGVYLDGGEMGEILLPARYVPEGCKPGDELDVFLYLDNEERLVATTLRCHRNRRTQSLAVCWSLRWFSAFPIS